MIIKHQKKDPKAVTHRSKKILHIDGSYIMEGFNFKGDLIECIYYNNKGVIHRERVPAIIRHYFDLHEYVYVQNGILHRKDNPAIITEHLLDSETTNICAWWYKGSRHRLDGPAVYTILDNGDMANMEWYISGVRIETEELFLEEKTKLMYEIL